MTRHNRAVAVALTVVVIAALGLLAKARNDSPVSDAEPAPGMVGLTVAPEKVTVLSVIDGDTFHVRRAGVPDDKVRIIGVNTPEVHKPGTPVECFGPEAAAATTSRLPIGSQVTLEADTSDRDNRGRLLRYVRLPDGTDLGFWLLLFGYAKATPYKPDTARAKDYAAAQVTAEDHVIGLWSRCEEDR
jgi:micrococcal nuclease